MSSPSNRPASLRITALDIADPRSDRATGTRAVEPPVDTRQAIRGSLYACVELRRADGRRLQVAEATRVQLSERLLSTLQRVYYSAKGTQSSVLVQAVQQALALFDQHRPNAPQPLEVDIVCAALLGEKLSVLATGEGFALAATPEAVQLYPAQPDLPNASPTQADADAPDPAALVHRLTVSDGDALFLGGGSWGEHVGARALAEMVAATNPNTRDEVVDHLWRTISQQMDDGAIVPGLLLTLEASEGANARPPSAAASSTPAVEASPRELPPRASSQPPGLPTSVYAPPPARDMPAERAPLFPTQTVSPQAAPSQAAPSQAAPSQTSATGAADGSAAVQVFPASGELAAQPESAPFAADASPDEGADWRELTAPAAGVAERVAALTRGGANSVRNLLRSVLPDRGGSAAPNPLASPAPTAASAAAPVDGDREPRVRPTVVFTPPKAASGRRTRLIILAAVLIALLVPMVVLAVTVSQGNNRSADANILKVAAAQDFDRARTALDNGDERGALSALSTARQSLREAEAITGARDDEINELEVAIDGELRELYKVRSLYGLVNPLAVFPVEADPHALLVVGQDIYVLDRGRNLVERFRLDEQNEQLVEDQREIVLQQGQEVGGAQVGMLQDMAWQPPNPGFEDRANLLVLDRNNNVFRYNGRVEGATLAVFGDQGAWDVPIQIQTYNGNVYLADEGRQQIYRYAPAGSGFDEPPSAWFASDTFGGGEASEAFVNLSGLRDMLIDGDIWLLFADGRLLPYNQGVQRPFELENSLGLLSQPVDAFVDAQESGSIYVADADEGSVLVYNSEGEYQYQMRAAEEDPNPLRNLSSIYVDETGGRIYLLTKRALFVHPLLE